MEKEKKFKLHCGLRLYQNNGRGDKEKVALSSSRREMMIFLEHLRLEEIKLNFQTCISLLTYERDVKGA